MTSTFSVTLFYSYSHKDTKYKEKMQKSLAFLKKTHLLKEYSDRNICPGQSISNEVKKKIENANIIVFLFSQNFIDSDECWKEWKEARKISSKKLCIRIPIILTKCAWQDMLNEDDIKVLPLDGKPINNFSNQDDAWNQVYEGIKEVIDQIKKNFSPKPEFIKKIETTDFISQDHIRLQDIFIFPHLLGHPSRQDENLLKEEKIITQEQLFKKKYIIIHGEEMSGKTALGKHSYLSLIQKSKPVLYINLDQRPSGDPIRYLRKMYQEQFNGDYDLWEKECYKTLILDNLSSKRKSIDFVIFSKGIFDKIVITLSSDIFNSFFRDEPRLSDFFEISIQPLKHGQQEKLIKKRLQLSDNKITDGLIDRWENHVNSIISLCREIGLSGK